MADYGAKLIRINLSSGRISREEVDPGVVMDFIGGRGLGVYYLYREVPPGTDPLGEGNKLFLLNGPLAGSNVQSASRWMAVTLSPLTRGYARSVAGADFGAWLRWAGYDCIALEGRAEKPVYIHLTADSCSIHDAGEIWGKDTVATQEWLCKQHGETTRSACIGQAGENLVNYAAIVTGRRTCGRCGTGTVMGSKNLKAIAINAQRNMRIHDPEAFRQLVKQQIETYKGNKGFQHHLDVGTTTTHDTTNDLGIYPVQNFRYGQQENYQKLSGEEYRKLRVGEFNCYSCMARCGKAHLVKDGPYKGAYSEGPEYETIWAFSGPADNNNLEATIAADQLCDDLGLDTISTGNTIGFAFELYEKGIITKKDTDGLELAWGNHGAMVALIRKIALREGIGNLLAQGTRKIAAAVGHGSEAYAIHVKGLELPAYEPRGAKAHGYNYATSNIGASHCYGYASQEIFGVPIPRAVDRFSETDKVDIVILNQNNAATNETGIGCQFTTRWGWFPGIFGKLLATATGIEQFGDEEYLRRVGDRIITLERAYNARNGFGRKDDTLPQRMLAEPLHTRKAPGEGQVVREQDKFLDSYYQLRGWTGEGIPTAKKLDDSRLAFAAKDMPRSGHKGAGNNGK